MHAPATAPLRLVAPAVACVAALLLVASATPAGAAFTFAPRTLLACPGNPMSIAVGDINEDGILDLVVVAGPSQYAAYFLGTGNGNFGAQQTVPRTIYTANSVALGRFVDGGHLDIAVSEPASRSLLVLPGNGDATFGAPLSLPAGIQPRFATTGDFDLDGHVDLACTNSYSNTLTLYAGHGDGTFGPELCYGTDPYPWSLWSVDLDRDGRPDFACTSDSPGGVNSIINHGGTDFYPRYDLSAPGVTAGAVGDLDGDLDPDMAVTVTGAVQVCANAGGGVFTLLAPTYPATGTSRSMATGDFDGDGHLDLVRANWGDTAVSIFPGNGDMTFAPKVDFGIGASVWSVAVADLDGDGDLDIVAAEPGAQQVAVLINTRLTPAAVGPEPPPAATLLAARPNPSRGPELVFQLPRAQTGTLAVLDAQGRVVRTLVREAPFAAGRSVVSWDGRDDAGDPAAPGLYFARLRLADGSELSRKLELLR